MPYRLGDLSNAVMPNADRLLQIMNQADADEISRDTRPLARTSMRVAGANLRIGGHMLIRQCAVTSFGWTLTPFDSSDQKYADTARKSLKRAIYTILENHGAITAFGALALRLEWAMPSGESEKEVVVAEEISPDLVEQGDGGGVTILGNSSQLVRVVKNIKPQDYRPDYITASQKPAYEKGGILRWCLPLELMRRAALRENANFLQKIKGILQIIDKFAGAEVTAAAEQAAKTVVKNDYVITNNALEFKLNQITSAGGNFKEFVELLNSEISIAFLGQANTTELPRTGGSRAALEVLKKISADIHYSDIVRVQRIINEQLLPVYWQINQNKNATEAPFEFTINLPEEEDSEKNVIVIREALGAGVPLRNDEVYSKIKFTPPKPGDTVFEPKPIALF